MRLSRDKALPKDHRLHIFRLLANHLVQPRDGPVVVLKLDQIVRNGNRIGPQTRWKSRLGINDMVDQAAGQVEVGRPVDNPRQHSPLRERLSDRTPAPCGRGGWQTHTPAALPPGCPSACNRRASSVVMKPNPAYEAALRGFTSSAWSYRQRVFCQVGS